MEYWEIYRFKWHIEKNVFMSTNYFRFFFNYLFIIATVFTLYNIPVSTLFFWPHSLQQRDELSRKHSAADGLWSQPGTCSGTLPVRQQHQRYKPTHFPGGAHRHPGHAGVPEPSAGPPVLHLSANVQRVPAQAHAYPVYREVGFTKGLITCM